MRPNQQGKKRSIPFATISLVAGLLAHSAAAGQLPATAAQRGREVIDDLPGRAARPIPGARPSESVTLGPYASVQVNVDSFGANIIGDAANEPSIAVDPTNPNRMAIGWRQFDTIVSNFRQAGVAYTRDGGRMWTSPGVLEPGIFRSDPVLDSDGDGNFYYNSLKVVGGVFDCWLQVHRRWRHLGAAGVRLRGRQGMDGRRQIRRGRRRQHLHGLERFRRLLRQRRLQPLDRRGAELRGAGSRSADAGLRDDGRGAGR